MTNLASQPSGSIRKYGLPVIALVVSVVSPIVGAVLGAFALKQIANRQSDPSKKKLALAGMIALAVFATLYTAIAVVLVTTGYDPYP